MDPITQGTLGAAAALAALPRLQCFQKQPIPWGRLAWMGALGGMAADLDVLIRSADDPLLSIYFHRHFTHSLAFIPVGGAFSALPWLIRKRYRVQWQSVMLATTVGYATHALLDACTTYGTLLLWPFSMLRVSWHLVSVIDPLFTFPLLGALFFAVRKRSQPWIWGGLMWAGLYLCCGFLQQQRALSAQAAIAAERGHAIQRRVVLPQFMNNVTWRSLYQADGTYYVDKIRVTWAGRSCVSPGTSVPVVPTTNASDPKRARAHELFRWFASDWVARAPNDPSVLGDLRYSFTPQEAVPIWGIRDRHLKSSDDLGSYRVEWVNNRSQRAIHWTDLKGLIFRDASDARCF